MQENTGRDNAAPDAAPAHEAPGHWKHWLEKLQVEIAAAAALAAVYFAGWRLVRPDGLTGVMAFLPAGDYAALGTLAVLVWAVAAGCAICTLHARPEGALLATLVGAAGVCFRSQPAEALLREDQTAMAGTFHRLAAEMPAMAAVLFGAVLVVAVVRAIARRLRPGWVWVPPDFSQADAGGAGADSKDIPTIWHYLRARPRRSRYGPAFALGCLVMELAIAAVLLVVTFRSTDRGQIAFALAASFFVAALAAHTVFPVRGSVVVWVGPLLLGAAVLAVGGDAAGEGPPWLAAMMVGGYAPYVDPVPLRAALPVDWLAMGAGGAVGGYWLSSRIFDLRHHERLEEARNRQAGKA